MCQKQNQDIIKATDVWVSELGGYEMIIFIEHPNCAKHFCDMLSLQDISVPSSQMRTLRNCDNERYLNDQPGCELRAAGHNVSLLWLQFFTRP